MAHGGESIAALSSSSNRRHQVNLAIRSNRREPRILKHFTIDRDRVATVQMRRKLWVALPEHAQQLTHIGDIEVDLRGTASELPERSA